MSVNEKLTAIADAIRSKTGDEDKLTLDDMAGGVAQVFAAGMRESGKISYTNLVPLSTDEEGNVFNGLGYMDDVRLSSSGGISSSAQLGSTTTGFIPWTEGEIIRLKGVEWLGMYTIAEGHHYYICFYNADKTFLYQIHTRDYANGDYGAGISYDNSTGVTTINSAELNAGVRDIIKSAAYFRINAFGRGVNFIVTVNEEIKGNGGGGYTEADLQAKYNEGAQSEYDRFWDAYQQNGNRINYDRAFGGAGWTAETFKPKYLPIRPTTGNLYMSFAFSDVGKIDDSILDTSQLKGLSMTFYQMDANNKQGVYHVEIDCSSLTAMVDAFNYNGYLKTVVLKNVQSTCNFTGGFANCPQLTNFTVTGIIGGTHLNLQWSTKLSKASIENIIEHLSTTSSGMSITFSKTAVNNAFTDEEWATLANARPNWTINLV